MYIVEYTGGSYDDFYTHSIFITDKKSKATKYCTKFNKLLKKWKKHYSQYEDNRKGMTWIKDDCIEKYKRWSDLRNISHCYWNEIDFR